MAGWRLLLVLTGILLLTAGLAYIRVACAEDQPAQVLTAQFIKENAPYYIPYNTSIYIVGYKEGKIDWVFGPADVVVEPANMTCSNPQKVDINYNGTAYVLYVCDSYNSLSGSSRSDATPGYIKLELSSWYDDWEGEYKYRLYVYIYCDSNSIYGNTVWWKVTSDIFGDNITIYIYSLEESGNATTLWTIEKPGYYALGFYNVTAGNETGLVGLLVYNETVPDEWWAVVESGSYYAYTFQDMHLTLIIPREVWAAPPKILLPELPPANNSIIVLNYAVRAVCMDCGVEWRVYFGWPWQVGYVVELEGNSVVLHPPTYNATNEDENIIVRALRGFFNWLAGVFQRLLPSWVTQAVGAFVGFGKAVMRALLVVFSYETMQMLGLVLTLSAVAAFIAGPDHLAAFVHGLIDVISKIVRTIRSLLPF